MSYRHTLEGKITTVSEGEEDDIDEVRCCVWFNGIDDSPTDVLITVPANTFNVRDEISVTIEKVTTVD